jgi:hypothetical protein
MAVNPSDRRRFTLLDHNGPWCGWCLKTILANEPKEVHHVLPTEAVRKLLGWDFRLPWTVPAHHDCHREQLHLMSGGLSAFLQRALTLPGPRLDKLNEKLHELGFYWFPVLTYGRELGQPGPGNADRTAYFFSSASGVRRGRQIAAKILGKFVPRRSDALINLSNLEFSSGSFQRSHDYLHAAHSLLSSSKQHVRDAGRAAFLRRKAQLELDSTAASEAEALSASNPYTVRTAILQQGWISFTRGEVATAIPNFESLEEATNPTWLYRAEVLFAHALCSLAVRTANEESYACLATAQYLYAMLGMVGPSFRFLWYIRDRAPGVTPTDVLLNDHRFQHFRKEQCFEMRRMAIFGCGRARVLATVLGDHNLRDTLFDGLHHAFPKRV